MDFDWINFVNAVNLLKEAECPLHVLNELRVIVVEAIKNGRLVKKRLAEFDLIIGTKVFKDYALN